MTLGMSPCLDEMSIKAWETADWSEVGSPFLYLEQVHTHDYRARDSICQPLLDLTVLDNSFYPKECEQNNVCTCFITCLKGNHFPLLHFAFLAKIWDVDAAMTRLHPCGWPQKLRGICSVEKISEGTEGLRACIVSFCWATPPAWALCLPLVSRRAEK